jgi:hypothetical protein
MGFLGDLAGAGGGIADAMDTQWKQRLMERQQRFLELQHQQQMEAQQAQADLEHQLTARKLSMESALQNQGQSVMDVPFSEQQGANGGPAAIDATSLTPAPHWSMTDNQMVQPPTQPSVQASNELAPVDIPPVRVPGVGPVGAMKIQPQTREQLQRQAAQAAMTKAMTTPEKLGQGEILTLGGQTIASGAPKEANAQTVDVTLDGKPYQRVIFNPQPAPGHSHYSRGGEELDEGRVTGNTPASIIINQGKSGQGNDDIKIIADEIENGDQPPDMSRMYGKTAALRTELGRRGYNLSSAALDWQAAQRFTVTANGNQQLRLRQALEVVPQHLGLIKGMAQQWNGGAFPPLNSANLKLAQNGAYGPQAQKLATGLTQQITDLTSEMSYVYMGGNTPTDHAMQLAAKNLSADWSLPTMLNAIDLIGKNIQIRQNSINNVGVAGRENSYLPQPQGQAPQPPPSANRVYYDSNGNPIKK